MKITADFERLHSGENNSRALFVEKGSEYEDKSARLGFITPMGRIYISELLEFSDGVCTYLLPGMLLDGKGKLLVQLILFENDVFTVKSPVEEFPVFSSVDTMDCTECTDEKLMSLVQIVEELVRKSDVGHTHGDIYYTKAEVETLLASKSDSTHLHKGVYITKSELETLLPEFPGSSYEHNHDTRYYTKTEIDGKFTELTHKYHFLWDTASNTFTSVLTYENGKSPVQNLFEDIYSGQNIDLFIDNGTTLLCACVSDRTKGSFTVTDITAEKIYSFTCSSGNIKLEGTYSLEADAVIEEGTYGIWTYRKWSSGIAECWFNTKVVFPASSEISAGLATTAGESFLLVYTDIALPITFVEPPSSTGSCDWKTTEWMQTKASYNSIRLRLIGNANSIAFVTTDGIMCSVQINGRWK